jgi:hypothetical protein
MLSAVTIQMGVHLELYLDTDTLIPELASSLPLRQHKEIKRRIWWFMHLADAFIWQSNGQPKWIDDTTMRVPLQAGENIWTRPPGPPSADELEDEETEIALMSSNAIYLGGLTIRSSSSCMLLMVTSVSFSSRT